MDDIGGRRNVWEDNGNKPDLDGKGVVRPEGRYPRRSDRASALSGLARSLIETCQLDSQPVVGRPVNHSRMRDRFDKVTGNRPAGSSFPVNPPQGVREVMGAAGFPAALGTRAQSERFPTRAAHSIAVARSIAATGFACLLPTRGKPGQAAVVRAPIRRNFAPPGIDAELEAGFANLQHPQSIAQPVVLSVCGGRQAEPKCPDQTAPDRQPVAQLGLLQTIAGQHPSAGHPRYGVSAPRRLTPAYRLPPQDGVTLVTKPPAGSVASGRSRTTPKRPAPGTPRPDAPAACGFSRRPTARLERTRRLARSSWIGSGTATRRQEHRTTGGTQLTLVVTVDSLRCASLSGNMAENVDYFGTPQVALLPNHELRFDPDR